MKLPKRIYEICWKLEKYIMNNAACLSNKGLLQDTCKKGIIFVIHTQKIPIFSVDRVVFYCHVNHYLFIFIFQSIFANFIA